MKYIDHGKGGPPSCMILREGPVPRLKAGEALIDVAFAGVNRPDVFQRMGAYPPPPDASPILGLEVAGRIAAVADDVTEWTIGDPVCALSPGSAAASHTAARYAAHESLS